MTYKDTRFFLLDDEKLSEVVYELLRDLEESPL
jgi:hypothetical protein